MRQNTIIYKDIAEWDKIPSFINYIEGWDKIPSFISLLKDETKFHEWFYVVACEKKIHFFGKEHVNWSSVSGVMIGRSWTNKFGKIHYLFG